MNLKKLIAFIKAPFCNHFVLFMVCFVAASICDVITRLYVYNISFSILFLGIIYTMTYLLLLPIDMLPCRFQKYYKYLAFVLISLNTFVDLICLKVMDGAAFSEFLGVIAGTNINEMMEFSKAFLSWNLLLYFLAIVLLLTFLWWFFTKLKKYSTIICNLSLLFIISEFILLSFSGKLFYFQDCYLGKIYQILTIEETPNLAAYYSNPILLSKEKNKPQNIIIVIGESFSKEHSSLYGYEKKTNPMLEKLRNDSSLFVFENVRCAEIQTVPNIKCILSTYTHDNDSIKWYKCITVPEILHLSGYKTFWISNQSEKGLWDNVTTKFAELCDSVIFVGSKYGGFDKVPYDEKVLDPLSSFVNNNKTNHNVFFVHLMGSHPEFSNRYPGNRALYTSKDYSSAKPNQRERLAHYDNSVLYNDSVVSEIFKTFKDEECLGFYFSDHSLDIFNTDEDYAGHARPANPKSVDVATKVPFVIYLSDSYKRTFSNMEKKINDNRDTHFNTENFVYTLMDIIGVDFEDEKVATQTLFR